MNASQRSLIPAVLSRRKITAGAGLCLAAFLVSGCFSVSDKKNRSFSLPPAAAAKTASVQEKAQALKQKKPSQLPETLGGVIASDRWVVYQEKEEEVFEGNVRYDNGVYAFRAGYALSQRKLNRITVTGNVYGRYNAPDGAWYELYADKAVYNYQSGAGHAQADGMQRIKLVYRTSDNETITAWAKQAEFNTQDEIYHLIGNAVVTYQDIHGQTVTLKAQEITAKQKENYAVLQGGAQAQNADYLLKSQTIEYNGQEGYTYAYGGRPLVQGKTPDGTFAIIADEIRAENSTRKIKLTGRVEGWTISEKLNSSRTNETL